MVEIMSMQDTKINAFFENTRLLQEEMQIIPLLYGSLGLEYLTKESLSADDIDILIPGKFLSEQWRAFRAMLERNGYCLIDAHEHTFEKNGIHFSYARLEELESFAGIAMTDIQVLEANYSQFRLLTLEQYLKVYTASSKDGYRMNVKEKKDQEKIDFIRSRMAAEIWDAYLADGTLAGCDLVRGEPIPKGLYHLVSDILVRHTDGDYLLMQRDHRKPNYGGYFEATAGGSALKGEDALTCAKRELWEETGITTGTFTNIRRFVSRDTIYEIFLCVTDWDKHAVTLREGETVSYKWISEADFIAFVNSDSMIDVQYRRYEPYLKQMGFILGGGATPA